MSMFHLWFWVVRMLRWIVLQQNSIEYFRGSESDKLERWNGSCKKFNVDFFVTADGDDLFCEPELIDLAFKQQKISQEDFIESEKTICGAFTYGISTTALSKVCEIKDPVQENLLLKAG